ncbi:hypothetical protein [Trichocoleus sp. FACHB-262]|uniref:hypothetical protein n=1 Tax=Trichocoleus sp. FACHB-262 TaxID=2692869 RepID=UPI001686D9CB|nr:hypothetical protein [Trichocoleus sp. FACHB-262]MBD2120786.1 hypothetical protein [Trichocoleus sp. FACHB-262]
MSESLSLKDPISILTNGKTTEFSLVLANVRHGVWLFGIPAWLFAIIDRSFSALADSCFSAVEILHLSMASLFFVSWLCLKPEESSQSDTVGAVWEPAPGSELSEHELFLQMAQARMTELEEQHMIRQEYDLPFPQLCQIYHLLNLKHLENVHSFSLNNLRIVKVSQVNATSIGGYIKFQTILESPFNVLRIWRQPIVEVDLILHSPYTVELSIPVYNEKRITVLFNAIPLSETEHKFLIDIYSDLPWPKPLLQAVLHVSACLTLFEDLPYLHKLAQRNLDRLVNSSRLPSHETMWLFGRFVSLYGSSAQSLPAARAIA